MLQYSSRIVHRYLRPAQYATDKRPGIPPHRAFGKRGRNCIIESPTSCYPESGERCIAVQYDEETRDRVSHVRGAESGGAGGVAIGIVPALPLLEHSAHRNGCNDGDRER
jgi:hypothetical protein